MADFGRINLVVQDESGDIVDGASIEVRNEVGLALASLFSNRTGTTPLGNPFTATDGSDAGFYVNGGAYKITATLGLFSKIWRYVPIGTAAERDIEDIYDNAALTGTPTAPTAALGTDTTQIATMAAIQDAFDALRGTVDSPFDTLGELSAAIALKANIASPTFTGVPAAPTASPGNNSTQLATTAYVDAVVGGAMVLIQTQTASVSSTIEFSSNLNDTYDAYMILLDGIKVSNDDSALHIRVSAGNSPDFEIGSYQYNLTENGSSNFVTSASAAQIVCNRSGSSTGIGNATGEILNGHLRFSNPESTQFMSIAIAVQYIRADSVPISTQGSGAWTGAAGAIDAIQFLLSAGTFTSGRFTLYGIKKA